MSIKTARPFSARSLSLSGKTIAPEVYRQSAKENCLREYANRNRLKGNFNDVTINVGEHNFPANRLVLSCFSKFFEELFTSEASENYNWDGREEMRPEAMEQILEFFYTGTIQIDSSNVCSLLTAANLMQLEEVKQFCFDFLETAITAQSAITIQNLAEKYKSVTLQDKIDKFTVEHLNEIINTDGFKNLTFKEMLECLFKHDRTQIGEVIIYKAIMQWATYDLETRHDDFQELFRKVDLSLLPIEYLEDVISHEPLVRGNLACLKRLHDAIVQAERESRTKDNRKHLVSLGGHRTLSKVAEIYNLNYGEKTFYPNLPQGVSSLCAVVLNDYLYCIGGQTIPLKNEMSTNHVYRMDLKSKDRHWEKVTPTGKKRYVMGATVLHGNIFVIGGTDESGCRLSSGEYFSPKLVDWRKIAPLKRPRTGSAVVACRGYVYAIGGFGNEIYLNKVERFNVHTNEWSDIASMQVARRWLAAVVLNDVIYVIGGQPERDNKTILKSVEAYDITNDTWRFVGDLNTERAACSACVMQGRIYVSGGLNRSGTVVKTIESYDPNDREWRIAGKTEEELWHHAMVSLP